MEQFLAEQKGLKLGSAPVSMTDTPIEGARIGLKDQKRVAIVVALAASASAVLSVTLRQHNAATSGTSKNLEVDNAYYHKVGAATAFTKVQPTAKAATYDIVAAVGNNAALVVFEVLQEDLDVNGDFSHVSLNIVGDATARLVAVHYVGDAEYKPAYALDL
jgi:hypothetical protein